jgi:pimeloyl-ACP methyl ester carboxylesterase
MAIFLTTVKYVCLAICALACYGATYQYIGTILDEQKYPPIGKMIDIGGYRLHMIDQGVSLPTVVIDSGACCNCLDWSLIQPEIAKFSRVITYDRAGYAWSDASPLDRTSENIVEELRTMLQVAGVPGPYVLIGHSFGGNNMRMYAMKYPDEVAGIVLVDSAHENLFEAISLPAIEYFRLMKGAIYFGVFRLCAHVPFLRNNMNTLLEKYPLEVREIYYAQAITNKFIYAVTEEADCAQESCKQLQSYSGSLGNKPLTVITAGKSFMSYEEVKVQSVYTKKQVHAMNENWLGLQKDLVKKSLRGKQIIAMNSGHMIPLEDPNIIVEAVRDMIYELAEKSTVV